MTTAMNDSFDRFGANLTEVLLQYLPIDDKLRLESVSKRWQSLIFNGQIHLVFDGRLFKQKLLSEKEKLKLFETIVKKCPNITTVIVSDVYLLDGLLDLINRHCDQLIHISLSRYHTDDWTILEPIFDQFIDRFAKQLQTFKFAGNVQQFNRQLLYKVCDQRLTNLKTVDITGTISLNDLFTDSHFKGYRLPNGWQSFDIKLADEQSLAMFSLFAGTYGKQMRSLDISVTTTTILSNTDYHWSVIGGLSSLSQKMPQLRQLSLNFVYIADYDLIATFLSRIGRNCRQLLSLNLLLNRTDISLIGQLFDTINENLSQLRQLSLNSNYYGITANSSSYQLASDRLNRMNRLIHLSIRVNKSGIIGDHFFVNIHQNLPRLQSLAIRGQASITNASLISLVKLSQLTDVYIDGDTKTLTTTQPIIEYHLLSSTDRSKIKHLFIKYMDLFDGIKEFKLL
ncbi:uncharacterized protein LOC128954401 [Oppia nitens]|uniref:uncharacterized protein LOC128954401 n=1 Tax=Oppia nitens TaxID=1686743 RepID=UPI0023DBC386|nr:uncharacterized protein LOC128954401 [Oppia nitens]XP_054155953.1 uncharacterized protein LOC128954401 [Oppia nitens]XP_054155954.1 uncharacterized protein LOC128954401 [Oppia nitens]